ncbi:MAG: bifunctional diguanylate cyclase/phosphodiesterase [Acidimicrobiaceae bacterium]|nr:bifunctional diguanylate cyclase/phosphodiesterase [Acidimicrobiaceae bacterium]
MTNAWWRRPPWQLAGVERTFLGINLGALALCSIGVTLIWRRHLPVEGWEKGIYDVTFSWPAVVMWRRGRSEEAQRAAWWSMALGIVSYSLATALTANSTHWHLPGVTLRPSDLIYFVSYGALVNGVFRLTQSRLGRINVSARLDGAITGLSVGALAVYLWFEPILGSASHLDGVVVDVVYPIADLVLLVLLVSSLAPNRYRPNWSTGALLLGVGFWVLGDVVYLHQVVGGGYHPGTLLDLTWPLGTFLMGVGASVRDRRVRRPALDGREFYDVSVVPVAAGLLSIVVIVIYFAGDDHSGVVLALALGALVLVIGRMWLSLDEERHLVASVSRDARTDPLTSLLNRRGFFEYAQSQTGPIGVVLIDLDGFKDVNDTLGHQAGDELLRVMARRLEARSGTGVLARLGGDEFALASPVGSLDEFETRAHRLRDVVSNPFALDAATVRVGASAGVSVGEATSDGMGELLRRADVAMYHAKRFHRGVSVYHSDTDPNSLVSLELAAGLERALTEGEIIAHYQPTYNVAHRAIEGVEALARWSHPELGLLGPDRFIGLAESVAQIGPLTRHILRRALDDVSALGRPDLSVSVNISGFDLLDEGFADLVLEILDERTFDPRRLTLEITETALVRNLARGADVIRRLREVGVRWAIDDYGVGYSSLSQLLQLQIDELKIDQSFVTDLVGDTRAQTIVQSAIDLAHRLDLRVVAEGVETNDVLKLLGQWGVDIIQGYYIARPMPPELLGQFLGLPVPASRDLGEK